MTPLVKQHNGILISEQCSNVGCSRLAYNRSFLMNGMELQLNEKQSPWVFFFNYSATGGYIKQNILTDTDVDNRNGQLKKEGPRIDLYKLHFRDTPYGYSGGYLWAMVMGELKTKEYSTAFAVERSIFNHWSLHSEVDYSFSAHKREKIITSIEGRMSERESFWKSAYLPLTGEYTVNRFTLRIGMNAEYQLSELLSLKFQFSPLIGIFTAKDARPESQEFYRSYTFGGGLWFSADMILHASSRFDFILGFFQYRLYTKGNGEFYGSTTYYLRLLTPGWSVNLKEGGLRFGFKARLR